jgi:hypothetical protein
VFPIWIVLDVLDELLNEVGWSVIDYTRREREREKTMMISGRPTGLLRSMAPREDILRAAVTIAKDAWKRNIPELAW